MSAIGNGRRFERLLLLSAPISLGCFLVLFFSFASSTQIEKIQSRCLHHFANRLQGQYTQLNELQPRANVGAYQFPDYDSKYQRYWNRVQKLSHELEYTNQSICLAYLNKHIDKYKYLDISDVIQAIQKDEKILGKAPFQSYGIIIPEQTTLNVLGTNISISLQTLVLALQIFLVPTLLIWVTCLFTTRYREIIVIGSLTTITETFPHATNIYPVWRYSAPKRRSRVKFYVRRGLIAWCTFVRISLTSIFVIPPIFAYCFAMYLSPLLESSVLSFTISAIICLFTLPILATEALPWHSTKIFSNDYHPFDS